MGKQEDIFLESEGDAWFARNFWKMKDQEDGNDPVSDIIRRHFLGVLGHVLEFGCSNGWRLNKLMSEGRLCEGYAHGIDPSLGAISNGSSRFNRPDLKRGTVTAHPHGSATMDMIIYGFCLYVCDPEELFEIVTQADNALKDGGSIIIHDFDAEYPHSVPNHHVEGLMTYKMDWSRLWLCHPAYKLVEKVSFADGTAVWLLRKSQRDAFPCS